MKFTHITFIKSPTGAYKLAYSAGQTVAVKDLRLNDDIIQDMIETGFAIPAGQTKAAPKVENAKAKHVTVETRTRLKTKSKK